MALKQLPSFKASTDKMYEISQPAISGLNLYDLEYRQDVNQSPHVVNMMYRNGSLSKRYGQDYYIDFDDEIYSTQTYRDNLFIHSGTKIYRNSKANMIKDNVAAKKGTFLYFNQKLYYLCDEIYEIFFESNEYEKLKEKPDDWTSNYTSYYIYKNGAYAANTSSEWLDDTYFKKNNDYHTYVCRKIEPYVPIIVINRKPDGSGGNRSEAYNMVGTGFQNNFHGDGTSTVFKLTDKNLDEVTPKVTIDNEKWTYDSGLSAAKTFKVDYVKGDITLKSAAPSGTNNVEIIAYKTDEEWTRYHEQIVNSKYYACFGGNNNSRLFLAGGGKSMYFYSEVYDATYFPYTNYARVGNTDDDITGFGQQYNVLIIFKPTELFSLTYYQDSNGLGAFQSQVVNSSIGCDCPNTIQLINNQLTWLSSKEGICCLISTNIVDERNVRPISRNINKGNNDIIGLLEWQDIKDVVSADYDKKYFLANKKTGDCFMWDYDISPYYVSSSRAANPKDLDWFYFTNFFVTQFIKYEGKLLYISNKVKNKMVELNDSFHDFIDQPIKSVFMTPYLQFGAVDYLKTIKQLYVQCRGDTSSVIDIYYYTEKSIEPKQDQKSIRIGGKVWSHFTWEGFQWLTVNHAKAFRRKCSLKKVEMCAFLFSNEELDRDMSISHIGVIYTIVKAIK